MSEAPFPCSPSGRNAEVWERNAYAAVMGRSLAEVEPRLLTGEAANQWRYGTKASSKNIDAAIFYAVTGDPVPKASKARPRKQDLSPLERVRKAVAARKRAEAEYKRALQACKGLSVSDIARAAGVSRQRVYQALNA